MFRSGRWKSEKNADKVVFKLRFHAAKVPSVGDDGLTVSVVPAETGKPSAKSEKAPVREGSCLWDNPVYQTVKFIKDPKTGNFHEKLYNFVVGTTGSLKSSVIGEASIDLTKYIESSKVTLVSLPLENSKSEAVLNVSIQKMNESHDRRVVDESENGKPNYKDSSLLSRMSNEDTDETVKSNSDDATLNKGGSAVSGRRASSGSDLTVSSSSSSSGVEIPWQPHGKSNGGLDSGSIPDPKASVLEERQSSQWEWLGSTTYDSLSTARENFMGLNMDEAPDLVVEKLKSEVTTLSRQVEMSEMELQTLRKQIVKESKRGQGLFQELVCLKEERDSLRSECEKLRSADGVGGRRDEHKAVIEELRQELNQEKELNSNLRIQLRRTQEPSSGPVRRLDCEEKDDQEQKALEELLKQHGDVKDAHLLEQEIIRMRSELEICKRDKDELEMQMEQLALDYEIIKQENHGMITHLQQIQLQEELKTQCEYPSCRELEAHIDKLGDKLKSQSKETETALERIRELEDHIKILEDEIDKQAQGFEADLEDLLCSQVEQEKRAVIAEEALRKAQLQNANAAERLQEEVRKLSMQMASTFEANENLAIKALTEANDLRLQKAYLEERIKMASEENESIRDQYEIRLERLESQVFSLENERTNLESEIEGIEMQLQHQKIDAEETERLLSDEILMLKRENETHLAKIRSLSEEMRIKKNLKNDLEEIQTDTRTMEKQDDDNIDEPENKTMPSKTDAQESQNELSKIRYLIEEKELMIVDLQSKLDSLQFHHEQLKSSLHEDKLEKEKLNKRVLQLKSELRNKEELISTQTKTKDSTGRGTSPDSIRATSKSRKPTPCGSKEVVILKEKIKLLQGDIKSKESDLQVSSKAFREKEKNLVCKIQELEGIVCALSQKCFHSSGNAAQKVANLVDVQDIPTVAVKNTHQDSKTPKGMVNKSHAERQDTAGNNGFFPNNTMTETAKLEEKNKIMEAELKQIHEKYSEVSLKFAEVEGERRQLANQVRNLKNAQKAY